MDEHTLGRSSYVWSILGLISVFNPSSLGYQHFQIFILEKRKITVVGAPIMFYMCTYMI